MDIIKLVAFITMFLDHTYIFDLDFRLVGRVAFPLFAFLVAYNALYRTSDIDRYLARLFFFAVLSQPFYMFFHSSFSASLNILFTLSIGIFFIRFLGSRYDFLILSFLGLLALGELFYPQPEYFNYSWAGVFLIYSLAFTMEYRFYYILPFSLFLLYPWRIDYFLISGFSLCFAFFVRSQEFSFFSLRSKFFYFFYPLHLFFYKAFLLFLP